MAWTSWWRRRQRGGSLTVVAPQGMTAAAEEAKALVGGYAAALGVQLPPLLIELEAGRSRGKVERLEVEGGQPRYRLRVPLESSGRVNAAALRNALLDALQDAGLLRRELVGKMERPASGEGERESGEEERPPRGVVWGKRGKRVSVVMPPAVAGEELAALQEALSLRGLKLVKAKPYPAGDERARKLDSLGEIALQQPAAVAAAVWRLAAGSVDGRSYVSVPTPPAVGDSDMWRVAHALAGAEIVAGARVGHRRVFLRLPQGCELLVPYLEGEWLERTVARALLRVLGRMGKPAVAATQVAVRMPGGEEAEMDVLVLSVRELVWAECALRPQRLLGNAGRRRFALGEHLLPDDRRLVATVQATAEEVEELRRVYGCEVWQLTDGLERLAHLLELPSGRWAGAQQVENEVRG